MWLSIGWSPQNEGNVKIRSRNKNACRQKNIILQNLYLDFLVGWLEKNKYSPDFGLMVIYHGRIRKKTPIFKKTNPRFLNQFGGEKIEKKKKQFWTCVVSFNDRFNNLSSWALFKSTSSVSSGETLRTFVACFAVPCSVEHIPTLTC